MRSLKTFKNSLIKNNKKLMKKKGIEKNPFNYYF